VADGEVRGNAETTLDDSEPVERISTEEFGEDGDT
jgi:hypothetical protein